MQPAVMLTISEIAARHKVSKQAVSKAVGKLVKAGGIPVERDGLGRVVKVSLAHYEHARERFLDPSRTQAEIDGEGSGGKAAAAERGDAGGVSGEGASNRDPRTDSFEEAKRLNEWLKYERESIRHRIEAGALVRADGISEAVTLAGREIQTVVSRLQNRADELALAVSREGSHGLRVLLRKVAFDLNTEIADKLSAIATLAPSADAVETDEADA